MLLIWLLLLTNVLGAAEMTENTNPIIVMELESGQVVIRTRPDLAPKHVDRIVELVNDKFYDGLTFHRVID